MNIKHNASLFLMLTGLIAATLLGMPLGATPANDYAGPDKGDWNTAANWSAGTVPNGVDGTYYDVTNSSASGVVHASSLGAGGVDTINSLSFTGTGGLILSGGILAGAQANQGSTLSVSGPLLISGSTPSTLSNLTLLHSDAVQFTLGSGITLDSVALDGGLTLANSSSVTITGSFAHGAGATFNLGSQSDLLFGADETLDNATLNFTSQYAGTDIFLASNGTLTLGPNLTVNGKYARLNFNNLVNQTTIGPSQGGYWIDSMFGTFTNSGTVQSNGIFSLTNGTLINTGTIQALNGGRVELNPTTYSGSLGTIKADGSGSEVDLGGGTIRLDGTETIRGTNGGAVILETTLDNTGRTFDPAPLGGFFVGGVFQGGTIVNSNSLQFTSHSGILQDVTLDGGLNIGSAVPYSMTSVFIEGSFTHGAGAVFNFGNLGTLTFGSDYTFDNATLNMNLGAQAGNLSFDKSLTLGPNLTLQGVNADIQSYDANANLTNNTILNNTQGGTWVIQPGGSFTNNATVKADKSNTQVGIYGGLNSPTAQITNIGTMEAVNGGTLDISYGILNNTGTITAMTGGTLGLSPLAVSHLGAVTADGAGSQVFLAGGTLTPTDLSQTHATNGGVITLSTTLNAQGTAFDPLSIGAAGAFVLDGGTISGGTVTNSNLLVFTYSLGNNLQNVTLDSGLNIGVGAPSLTAFVKATGNLSHPDGAVFNIYGSTNGSSVLEFASNTTLDHATVNFLGASASSAPSLENANNTTLTLGPNLTLTGKTASFTPTSFGVGNNLINQTTLLSSQGGTWTVHPAGSLTNSATIEALNAGSLLAVQTGGSLINSGGLIEALNGGTVTLTPTTYSSLGTVTASGAGSKVTLAGGTLTLGKGEILSATNGGVLSLQTTVTNTSKTFDPLAYGPAGAFVLGGGTLSGGTIANSDSLGFTGTTSVLNNVTLAGGLNFANASAAVTIQGTFSHATGATFDLGTSGTLAFAGTYTLDNGTVNFGSAAAKLGVASGGTLTLGPNLILTGAQGVIVPTLGTTGKPTTQTTFVNQTTIAASGSNVSTGRNTVSIQASQATNQGTLRADIGGSFVISSSTVFTNTGTVSVTSGSVMAAPSFTQTAGQTVVDGQLTLSPLTGSRTTVGTLALAAGTLNGSGTLTGGVSNTGGVVHAGDSPGTLALTGAYAQGTGGTLLEQLGGTGAGQYGLLNDSGQATLDGTLDVSLLNGFAPTIGQSFTFFDYRSHSGAFASVVSLDPGYSYSVAYGPNAATLTVAAAPEPPLTITLGLAVGGLGWLIFRARRRHTNHGGNFR